MFLIIFLFLPSRATFSLSLKFTRSPHLHILHLIFIRFREVNPLAQGYRVSGDSFSPSLPSFFSYFLSLARLSFLQRKEVYVLYECMYCLITCRIHVTQSLIVLFTFLNTLQEGDFFKMTA